MSLNVCNLQSKITNLVDFLRPFCDFINCHMVEFITSNLWEKYIPIEIRNEISNNVHFDDIFDILYQQKCCFNPKFPYLTQFLISINTVLEQNKITVSLHEIVRMLSKNNSEIFTNNFNYFMSEKKIHEVNILAALVNLLSQTTSISHFVDIGDGKGYLSSLLALQYKLNVLGIDASSVNTKGSFERMRKMRKYWNGLTKTNETVSSSYKQTTCFVTEQTNLVEMLRDNFSTDTVDSIGLVGLHTCGNLASNSIRLFCQNENIQILCNVGCCYHSLDEEFTQDEFGPKIELPKTIPAFPMSKYLRLQRYTLKRNARMLACQSIDRLIATKSKPNRSLFYRALFQAFLRNRFNTCIPDGHVGRKAAKYDNFHDYVKFAVTNYHSMDIEIDKTEINDLLEQYASFEIKLQIFYLIRMRFALIIEMLILADRLLYLKENGFENSFAVKLFEPVISPRHLAIISLKDQ